MRRKSRQSQGFTLAELLIALLVLGIVAAVAIPQFGSFLGSKKLDVAAEEVANALRFALAEAQLTNGYVLVDGKTSAGHLKLYYSDAQANAPPSAGTSAVNDLLTKQAFDLDIASGTASLGVALTPQFRAGGQPWQQLLIGPGSSQLQGFDGAASAKGALQANSGVVLSYGAQSVTVAINEVTGLVTLP